MEAVGQAGGGKRRPQTGSVSVGLDVNGMTKREDEGSMNKVRHRPAPVREPRCAKGAAR